MQQLRVDIDEPSTGTRVQPVRLKGKALDNSIDTRVLSRQKHLYFVDGPFQFDIGKEKLVFRSFFVRIGSSYLFRLPFNKVLCVEHRSIDREDDLLFKNY